MGFREFIVTLQDAAKALGGKSKLPFLPREGEVIILGDIHGDQRTLNKILSIEKVEGWLGGDHYIVFLGDYVDRGASSVEVLYKVATLLLEHPDHVFLLRGNHEGPREIYVNTQGHYYEVARFGDLTSLLETVQAFMDELMTAAVIPGYAFLVHGHIPLSTTSLVRIAKAHMNYPEDPILIEMIWSDPSSLQVDSSNLRGHGYNVGTASTERFLKENNLKWVIRGHESHPIGYEVIWRTLTLHSLSLPIYGNPKPVYLKLPLNTNIDPITYLKKI